MALAVACNSPGTNKELDSQAAGLNQPTAEPNAQAANTTAAKPGDANVSSSPNAVTAQNANIVPTKAIAWPYLGFVNESIGNDNKVVALTFDDGPDGQSTVEGKAGRTNTSYVLDQLDALKLKATFFVNGNRSTDVLNDPSAIVDVKRILASGHAIGDHTYQHLKWDNTITKAQLADAIAGNLRVYQDPKIFGPNFTFTLWRSPYGVPFQDGLVWPPTAEDSNNAISAVISGTPPNAVHVGWGIDSHDWDCAGTAATATDTNCVVRAVNQFISQGASGVILMHAIYKLTGDALPSVVKLITDNGYRIVQVEDLVKNKYGVSSASIAAANAATKFDAATLNAAALAATQTSKWYKQTNEY